MKRVLIYRDDILPATETFIAAQSGALSSYKASLVGLERAKPSLPVPEPIICRDYAIFPRWIQDRVYNSGGVQPRWHRSQLISRLQAGSPLLLHAHFARDAVMAMPLVARLKIPFIVTLHGFDVTMHDSCFRPWPRGRLFLRGKSQLWESTSLFLCVSEFIRQKALQGGYPAGKLRVHYTGIDCTHFNTGQGSQRTDNLVLFVGRLTEMKGCEYLIRAMAAVSAEVPGAQLAVIGDGELRPQLETLANSLGVRCRFLGVQTGSSVREWLGKARIFCVPSVTAASGSAEGLGMVFLEAQAMGVPVVSCRTGGIPEAVCDGETGLLAEARDHQALAQHISRYLNDEAFWKHSSQAGPDWVRQRFDLHKQTRELEDIYDLVVQEGAACNIL